MSDAPRTVLIMAGGTGGHVFPALATAEQLFARGVHVEWLGTAAGIEARLVPAAGIRLHLVDVSGLRGKGWRSLVQAPLKLARALWQSISLLRRVRPDCVLGMGGFASGPGGLAAWLLRVPVVIHEQNAIAGTTNRLLSLFSTTALEAFPDALPDRAHPRYVGNPVRDSIAGAAQPVERYTARGGRGRLLVVGGSLGAKAINEVLPRALAALPAQERPEVLHQVGRGNEGVVRKVYQTLGVEARVEPFIEDMAEAYAWADVVLCRAGAMTVAELSCVGVASILVPFPHAVDDHQTANARWLAAQGAAYLLPQNELTVEKTSQLLRDIGARRDEWLAMALKARRLALPDAAERVALECMELCRDR